MTLLFHLQFNSGNIPAAPACGVYISQLIHYSNAFAQHSDCSGQKSADDTKATQTRLRGSYGEVIATKILRSLLWTGWPLRNIHFLHGNESFPFYVDGFFPRSLTILYPNLTISNTAGVWEKTGTAYPSEIPGFIHVFWWGRYYSSF